MPLLPKTQDGTRPPLSTLLSDHLLTLFTLSQKCDGSKPVCQQCTKANRAADCEYDDGKSKTRTQLLQEKIQRLESRIHQLEGVPSLPPQQQQQQQHSTNPRPPLQYSASAPPNLVDVPLHSSALASYASGHPNPISVYGSPRNTPSPPNRQSYFDENIFSTAPQPTQQFPGDVFLDPTSGDPLSLGEPLLPYLYPFPFPFPFPNTLPPANPPSLFYSLSCTLGFTPPSRSIHLWPYLYPYPYPRNNAKGFLLLYNGRPRITHTWDI